MQYWKDEWLIKMEQYRAIRQTANLGEPLDGDDALALLDILDAVMLKLNECQTRKGSYAS